MMSTKFKSNLFFLVALILIFITTSNKTKAQTTNFQSIRTSPGLSLHKATFMLPVTYSDEYNKEKTEAVFQISAKHRLFGSRFYFGYTQISFWQAYDHHNSAPFRETNYNPEIFYRAKVYPFKAGYLAADIGFEHESNGQRPPVSRSWNLIYISPFYYQSNFLVYLKLRYRIPEDEKKSPEDFIGDDNPDITDYLGYSDLNLYYRLSKNRTIYLTLRGNLNTGKGIAILNFSTPIPKSENSFILFRISHGYGESMVDYKREITRVGVGVMFSR